MGCDQPRLSWKLEGCDRATAYQIRSASVAEQLRAGDADLWDSGEVASPGLIDVPYSGRPLNSCERAYWQVRSKFDGEWSGWSDISFWERALVDPGEWSAEWISLALGEGGQPAPAQLLARQFEVPAKPIARARLHYTAKGLIRAYVNDNDVSAGLLDPGWTDYRHRILYRAVDVTSVLRAGTNKLSAIVGDGWYCGNLCWFGRNRYGARAMALLRLLVEFEDGDRLMVGSDSAWRGTDVFVRTNDLIDGVTQDFRIMVPDYARWTPVETFPIGGENLVPASCPPVRSTEVIDTLGTWQNSAGEWLIDFGQNHTGVLSMELTGACELEVVHGEALDAEGNLYTANLRTAKQTDLIVSPGGQRRWSPFFTFHGYRYARIAGHSESTPPMVRSHVLHTDLERTGWFECGHEGLNRLFSNIVWSMRSNFVDIPTDCPQRDERLGWLGDAQIFAPTAAYLYDVSTFFAKWMPDVISGMSERGIFPNIAPQLEELVEGAPGWADAGVIVPWTMYEFYGDERLLSDCYPAMKRYCHAVLDANPDWIWRNLRSHDFGDWLSIGEETDKTLLATAYIGRSLRITADAARVLGLEADYISLSKAHEHVASAFKGEFPLESIGTQTGLILAAQSFDLTESEWAALGDRLEARLVANGGKLATGFLGVAGLLETLASTGRDRLAMDLLLSTEFPSWLFPVENGATTIWERWDGWTPGGGFQDPGMNSFNHYCFGSVGAFFFERLAGIKRLGPAFNPIALLPLVDERLGFVDLRFTTRYGEIRSRWEVESGHLNWEVTIPSGCRAGAKLPRFATNLSTWSVEGPASEVEGNPVTRAFRLYPGRTSIRGPLQFDVG